MPEMIPVDSSMIESIGYEEETRNLHIRFYNGAHYVYEEVPETLYEQFLKSESVGKFFHRAIKDVYSAKKL